MLIELGLELDGIPTTIFIDNRGAIDLSKDSHCQQCPKHIAIQHHFIREHVEDSTFKITHCPSHLMLVDRLTKPLPRDGFTKMVDGLGLIPY